MTRKYISEEEELTDLIWKSLGKKDRFRIRADFARLGKDYQERIAKIENRFIIYRSLQDQALKIRVMQYILEDSEETNGKVPELLTKLGQEEKAYILYEIARTDSAVTQKAINLLFNEKYPKAHYFQAMYLAQTGNKEDKKNALAMAEDYEIFGLTGKQAQEITETAEN